jgi:hypothetical protein
MSPVSPAKLDTDYLIIGAGAQGMIFADQLLTDSDASMVIVDRRHMPSGHWNDAYSFIRLHLPTAYYGAGSRKVGNDRIEETGLNKGFHEQASGAEVASYFDSLMRQRFLTSGRVTYLPMSNYRDDGRVISLVSGRETQVTARKVVDATYFNTAVPATHPPKFAVREGVTVVPPNDLPRVAGGFDRFVIVGAGKTAMDTAIWLLQMGAAPDAIRWIAPRAMWALNREMLQPGDRFALQTLEAQARMLEAAAGAGDVEDLFDRLEGAGHLLRVHPDLRPTMYRGTTLNTAEARALATIEDVVRLGRVEAIERDRITLTKGEIAAHLGALYINCTAKGLDSRPAVPVFEGDRITLQMIRGGLVSLSAAMIAYVETAYADDAAKNGLCRPVVTADTDRDWIRWNLHDLQIGARWAGEGALRQWMAGHRLAGGATGNAAGDEAKTLGLRIRDARAKAAENLARLWAS